LLTFIATNFRLVIELDGLSHQQEEVQKKDAIKTKALEDLGITVLRFQDSEVFNDMDNVLRVINYYVECFEG
jgi:very-short-patch-repair endonuclease